MAIDSLKIHLQLDAGGAEETERFGLELKHELDHLSDVTVSPTTQREAPPNSKGLASIDWSQLLLTLSASGGALTTLIGLLRSRTSRRRKVTLVVGADKLELSGLGHTEQKEIIETWLARVERARAGT